MAIITSTMGVNGRVKNIMLRTVRHDRKSATDKPLRFYKDKKGNASG